MLNWILKQKSKSNTRQISGLLSGQTWLYFPAVLLREGPDSNWAFSKSKSTWDCPWDCPWLFKWFPTHDQGRAQSGQPLGVSGREVALWLLWDTPSSKPSSFDPRGLFLVCEAMTLAFCPDGVVVWLLVALGVTGLFPQWQQSGLCCKGCGSSSRFGIVGKEVHQKILLLLPRLVKWLFPEHVPRVPLRIKALCRHLSPQKGNVVPPHVHSWGSSTGWWQWCEGSCFSLSWGRGSRGREGLRPSVTLSTMCCGGGVRRRKEGRWATQKWREKINSGSQRGSEE